MNVTVKYKIHEASDDMHLPIFIRQYLYENEWILEKFVYNIQPVSQQCWDEQRSQSINNETFV